MIGLSLKTSMEKDLQDFKDALEALSVLSPSAKVFCLLHKADLLKPVDSSIFPKLFEDIKTSSSATAFEVQTFTTSIFDESLYKAWS